MDENRERLDRAVKRRDHLRGEVQRVVGKLEAARQEFQSVKDECQEKGVDPSRLAEAIEVLDRRYLEAVSELETRNDNAEQALKPFEGEL